ncbi:MULTISPECIES: SDR family oxidoreductase [unclassified Modicisalibacter]|uniref:SDR family oxidoreductase n=1 Tax=unclassified Modicisalibacter TaxID=2679913 RepID=UPI001CCB3C9C|nr:MULTISPECIES: SDR family oxidoreductase [unclassified Modicisalibacter]MBZ9559654.1 SDR family oxidoreductase [Modicisalibacter sp. R2A 31.J]MBZ9577106.1 SDR family oxidoreductase [Modicisalibacter sp. MOD 31.J]
MTNEFEIHAQSQTLPGSEAAMDPPAEMIRAGYRGADKLAGKVALITGGDSGIGRSVAIHFAREGADVAVVYLSEAEDAAETRRLVEAEGRRCHLIEGDLAEAEFCRRCIAETVDVLGGLNVLVNNAGTQWVSEDLAELPDEQWRRMFDVNMHSQFYLAKAALAHLGEGDSIINNASINAYIGPDFLVDYSATKGAIVSFTRSLSNQVVGRGIRVNAVAPGPVWTPLQPATLGAHDPQWLEGFGQQTPMGRPGQPSELGPVFVFLASLDASFISGQTIHPNGGTVVNG